jgi:hypothetical protein
VAVTLDAMKGHRVMSADQLAAARAARRASDEREVARREVVEAQITRRPRGDASGTLAAVRRAHHCRMQAAIAPKGVLRKSYDLAAIATSHESRQRPSCADGADVLRRLLTFALCAGRFEFRCVKDFVVTRYQIVEAAAAGADAVS